MPIYELFLSQKESRILTQMLTIRFNPLVCSNIGIPKMSQMSVMRNTKVLHVQHSFVQADRCVTLNKVFNWFTSSVVFWLAGITCLSINILVVNHISRGQLLDSSLYLNVLKTLTIDYKQSTEMLTLVGLLFIVAGEHQTQTRSFCTVKFLYLRFMHGYM